MNQDIRELSPKLHELFFKAVHCEDCFKDKLVKHCDSKHPHPRWVGPGYAVSSPRILLVMINPGGGGKKANPISPTERWAERFKKEECSLVELFWRQGEGMHTWGGHRALKFYRDGLDLDVFSLAFANIAWCAMKGNKPPKEMLDRCYTKHTSPLIKLLNPDIVILSGGDVQKFEDRIHGLVPKAKFLRMPHYAMRGSEKEKQKELKQAHKDLNKLKRRHRLALAK